MSIYHYYHYFSSRYLDQAAIVDQQSIKTIASASHASHIFSSRQINNVRKHVYEL